MSWDTIYGHEAVLHNFQHAVAKGRLASTFLFVGLPGIGKRTFAMKLAQALLCEANSDTELGICGTCPSCQQAAAQTHPDLDVVSKPADKNFIPVEAFIGDREHRMQVGLCHDISLKPFMGGRKIAIIDDADYLNQEGANSLLKTLEEPPPKSVLILIGTSLQRQLPTIRSRCQIVRFAPLQPETVGRLLLEQEHVANADEASALAALSGGSLRHALDSAGDELAAFRQDFLKTLSEAGFRAISTIGDVAAFVESAGKDAPPRRARLRQVIDIALSFYRGLLRELAGAGQPADADLAAAVKRRSASWSGDADDIAACIERCLDAHAHVDANANVTTMLECWIDDLSQLERGESLVIMN